MGRETSVFSGKNAALVGHELLEQGDILEIQRVSGEINFRLRTMRADFARGAFAFCFIEIGFAWHNVYLISRCTV